MSAEVIISQLKAISSASDFVDRSHDLVQSWHSEVGFGAKAIIDGVLRFMEMHPDLDFGSPGPLVHRLEKFSLEIYVPLLMESIARIPTTHTVWMLNRIINSELKGPWRDSLIEEMRRISRRADVTSGVKANALHFIEHQGKK